MKKINPPSNCVYKIYRCKKCGLTWRRAKNCKGSRPRCPNDGRWLSFVKFWGLKKEEVDFQKSPLYFGEFEEFKEFREFGEKEEE